MRLGYFKFQDNEEIDAWKPINPKLDNLDNQSPSIQETSDMARAEEVDTWKRVSDEAIRQMIVRQVMRLLYAWVISVLIVFLMTGNAGILTTAGLIWLLFRRILDYYFRSSK